ncbi:MAG TPA: hypothetical protein VMM18_13850 [Gemmatimonadaceae bacterium]|nr:hypothetical protein [Gemmatimonadaceae bacterium]
MKWIAMTCAAAVAVAAAGVHVQAQDTTRVSIAGLPADVVQEALATYNAAATLRASGRLDVTEEQRVPGDVAVLLGPLTIAGEVAGNVVVINGDLVLQRTARIGGGVLLVGGSIQGRDEAIIEGDVRVYRQPLPYREVDGRLEAEPDSWWRPWQRPARSRSRIRIVSAGAYNRVEGLPIEIGPAVQHQTSWGHVKLEGLGIIRTVDNFRWDSDNLGHSALLEVGFTGPRSIAAGLRHYDVVSPVEGWQLQDIEVALASFLFHRDYRDHYNRHGGGGYVTMAPGRDLNLTLSYADERWASRDVRGPFTLFRNADSWRPNPGIDDGRFNLANATLQIDTRNNPESPWTGWYITADYELGSGRVASFGPASPLARAAVPTDSALRYHRALVDLRRYNRISPEGQLNFRVVVGGWAGGDELPLQRRLSVGGAGSLPGFDFRRHYEADDVGMCTSAGDALPGHPAQCERIALLQAEYRGDISVSGWRWHDRWYGEVRRAGPVWVLFANAGRGWLVGERSGEIRYPSGSLPPLGTFRTDVGLGIDAGLLGLYIAKSTSHASEPANVFLRIRHRF